ncbi:MAG: type II toxin-antitoxin system VapC family toxin [Cyanobacteria bacterium P01_F01_bin.53]
MIIDASIAVKWFLSEQDSSTATALLNEGIDFTAPTLIKTEVSAAITKSARMKRIDDETAQTLCAGWFEELKSGTVRLDSQEQDDHMAVNMSIALGHPVQDCLYLAIAKRLSKKLITTDKKLIEKAPLAEVDVKTLDDFQA